MKHGIVWVLGLLIVTCGPPAPVQAHEAALRWQESLYSATPELAPHRRTRALALAWAAAFNAVNGCAGRFQAYGRAAANAPPAPAPAACEAQPLLMASALRTVMLLEPLANQSLLQKALDDAAAAEKDVERRVQALTEGRRAALSLLLERVDDRLDRAEPALRSAGPGVFVTPAAPQRASSARLGQMRPFTRASLQGLDPGPAPAPDSPAMQRDLDELRRLGSSDSRERSGEQTAAAIYWNSGAPNDDTAGHKPWVARHADSLVDALRVLALFALVDIDVQIAEVAFKERYQVWRPETALAASGWKPLVRTPTSPDYPSGTAIYVGALQRLMEQLPAVEGSWPLTWFNSETSQTRRFASAAALAQEAGEARIWAGVHWRSSLEAGWKLGRQLADEALRTQLRPR